MEVGITRIFKSRMLAEGFLVDTPRVPRTAPRESILAQPTSLDDLPDTKYFRIGDTAVRKGTPDILANSCLKLDCELIKETGLKQSCQDLA